MTARIYFGPQHLASAAFFAREASLHQKERREPQLIACVSAAVLLSAFSVEAMINEVLLDAADNARSRPTEKLSAEAQATLGKHAKSLVGSSNTRAKLQKVLSLLKLPPYDERSAPYEPTNALFEFRNALVHYEVTSDVIASSIPGVSATSAEQALPVEP